MAQMLQQTLSTNPIADFELQLNEPVSREDLARLYGLDLEKLDKLREDEAEDAEARAVSRELDVLAGIKSRLESVRKQIKCVGNIFHINLSQLPRGILSL